MTRGPSTQQAVLWISGHPVAKCDPLLLRAIQHDPVVARWATQLPMSGEMILQQITYKLCGDN